MGQGFTRYTTAIDHFYTNLNILVKENVFSGKKGYVFGSSKIAYMIVSYLKEQGIILEGILDNNKTSIGAKVLGLSIYSPEKLAQERDDNVLVLIASGYQDEMIRQLEDMGYRYGKHILKVIDLPREMEDYSFVDRSGYELLSEQEVKKSQLRVLRGLKEICEREKLQYYLMGGTLLGAVRHKGYIPWDDDIDVYVPITDLKRLVEAVNSEKKFGMASSITGTMDYYESYSMMYDNDTILDSNHFPMQMTTGITIDVFPIYGLPNPGEEMYRYLEELNEADLEMTNNLHNKTLRTKATTHLFELMEKYPMDKADYIGNILGGRQVKKVFPKKWFGIGKKYEFEGEYYNAPENSDAYLKAIYGDYMKLPPEEERQGHHFFHAYKIP